MTVGSEDQGATERSHAVVHDPPLAWPELDRVCGKIGPLPEHFVVEEIPAYSPCGEGEHWYIHLEKSNWTTQDALRCVARLAGVSDRDVGSAGLKDKLAVTRQWLSLPGAASAPDTWKLPEGLRILETSRHGNKLRTGHLIGNRFTIELCGAKEEEFPQAELLARKLREEGLFNYYGRQRFGNGGLNLPRAIEWVARGASRKKTKAFTARLYASVLQSEVFNRYLTQRRQLGLERPILGEIVRLEGTGSQFQIEDVATELPRWERKDIHPTGPMFGPKMKEAAGAIKELEDSLVAELGLSAPPQQLIKLAPGTRRDLRAFPEGLEVTASSPGQLRLHFCLPAGSYATGLVRELTGSDQRAVQR